MADWGLEELSLNGQSLKTYGYGVRLIGGLDVSPSKRGTDVTVAYARGQGWRPKRLDVVSRTLLMWVDGREADGTYAATRAERRARLNANIRELMALFATEESQLTCSREVLLPSGTEVWDALCEVQGNVVFDSEEDSDQERSLSVDLVFADPLWYGPPASVAIGGSSDLTNPGEVDIVNATIELSGGSNYVLTNVTKNITLTILASGNVTVDCASGTVDNSGSNAIGLVSVEGARDFMRFAPGINNLELSSGSGHVLFRPPRL